MTDTNHTERLRRLTGAKWARFDDDVIPAWVADMDFPTAPAVTEALRALVDNGDLGYNIASFDDRVVHAWADWSERRFGWRPDPAASHLFSSTLQPISMALDVATEPGDGVVLFTPIYPPFLGMVEKSGRRLVEYRLDETDRRIDGDHLAALVDDTTRAVLLCNPHNPTGRAFTAEELAAIAHVAEAHDLLVISDEIWQDFVYPGAAHVPFASLGAEVASRTVTMTSASKSFNLGGLSCAVAHLGAARVAEGYAALMPHLLGGVSVTGAVASLTAWRHGEPWLDEIVQVLHANRDHLIARLRAELPRVGVSTPEATYLAWLDFREMSLGDDPAAHLLEAARVGLSPGPDFGVPGTGFARLNFATPRPVLDEIIDRMVRALGG